MTKNSALLIAALAVLENIDFSEWPGLYDAMPWTMLEDAAAGPLTLAEQRREVCDCPARGGEDCTCLVAVRGDR